MNTTIASRLQKIEERIQQDCLACGRESSDVKLVAVSKKHSGTSVLEAYTLGLHHFGENYVQELNEKQSELMSLEDIHWHFIGHLQRNKVAKVLSARPALIHSLDSPVLALRIQEKCAELYPTQKQGILIELRIGDEDGLKTGLPPDELPAMLETLEHCPHLDFQGLMIIPPLGRDPEASRPYFKQIRELRDSLAQKRNAPLPVLSFGMSDDFEIAIQEGATHIRIGTAIFGEREY